MITHIPIEPAEHEVIQVRFTDHCNPTDMCAFCSIPSQGQWIPANACPAACAWRMTRDAPSPLRVIDASPAPAAPRAYEAAIKATKLLEQWDCGCPGEHHQWCSRYVPPPIHIPEEFLMNRRKCACISCRRGIA